MSEANVMTEAKGITKGKVMTGYKIMMEDTVMTENRVMTEREKDEICDRRHFHFVCGIVHACRHCPDEDAAA